MRPCPGIENHRQQAHRMFSLRPFGQVAAGPQQRIYFNGGGGVVHGHDAPAKSCGGERQAGDGVAGIQLAVPKRQRSSTVHVVSIYCTMMDHAMIRGSKLNYVQAKPRAPYLGLHERVKLMYEDDYPPVSPFPIFPSLPPVNGRQS